MEDVMHAVKSVSSHRVNKMLRRKGNIWLPGYYDRGLKDDCNPDTTIDYILRNPIKAGFVKNIRKFPHWDAKNIPDWVWK